LIITSLKAIGNIGYISDMELLESCAAKKENSLETRVNAIQAMRQFPCVRLEDQTETYRRFTDPGEDVELRINAFQIIMKCSDSSEKFARFVKEDLEEFLLDEKDEQVELMI
jgi:hypothetical protein